MEKKTPNQVIIDHDIMRYKKNKWAQVLALLGLVFNCLYFMLIYAYTGTFYYDSAKSKTAAGLMLIGVSVLMTLIILLMTFLSSENVKNYNKVYSYVLFVIAGLQVIRIFGFPLYGLNHKMLTVGYFGFYPTPDQSWVEFIILLVYLLASAACLIAAGILGIIQSVRLQKHIKKVESGEVDITAVVKEMEAEDEAKAVAAKVAAEEALKETEEKITASDNGEV